MRPIVLAFLATSAGIVLAENDGYGGQAMHGAVPKNPVLARATPPSPPPCDVGGGHMIVLMNVSEGDTLNKYADRFRTGVCDIAAASKIPDPNSIKPGQELRIPANAEKPDNKSCLPGPDRNVGNGIKEIIVKEGETLATLAAKYSSGICDIAKLNKMPDPNKLEIGQHLKIPQRVEHPDNESCLTEKKPTRQAMVEDPPTAAKAAARTEKTPGLKKERRMLQ